MSVFKKEEPAAVTNGALKESSAYAVSKTGGEVDSQTHKHLPLAPYSMPT